MTFKQDIRCLPILDFSRYKKTNLPPTNLVYSNNISIFYSIYLGIVTNCFSMAYITFESSDGRDSWSNALQYPFLFPLYPDSHSSNREGKCTRSSHTRCNTYIVISSWDPFFVSPCVCHAPEFSLSYLASSDDPLPRRMSSFPKSAGNHRHGENNK